MENSCCVFSYCFLNLFRHNFTLSQASYALKGSGLIFFFFNLVKRQDEDYDEQVEESLQDEVS